MAIPDISFWRSYAWLIANGIADVDSRLWSPPEKYLGNRIAIHASNKKITKAGYEESVCIQCSKDHLHQC